VTDKAAARPLRANCRFLTAGQPFSRGREIFTVVPCAGALAMLIAPPD
jgi:hypothetical protein